MKSIKEMAKEVKEVSDKEFKMLSNPYIIEEGITDKQFDILFNTGKYREEMK